MILSRCNLKFSGVLRGADQREQAIFDMDGFDLVSVQLTKIEGTWTGTTTVKVQHASDPSGPYFEYETPQTFTASGTTKLLAIHSRYLVVECTTGEGSDVYIDVQVSPRKTTAGTAGTV